MSHIVLLFYTNDFGNISCVLTTKLGGLL